MKYGGSIGASAVLLASLLVAFPAGAFAQSGDVVITSNTTWPAGNI